MISNFFLNVAVILSIATASQAQDKPASLYKRLGEKRAIAAVVDHFVNLAAVDPKVNFTRNGKFKGMDVPFLKGQLTDFISMVTGGPVKYSGKDMAAAHAGMKIKASEFDALAADLVKALDKFNVPAKEKAELMTLVASTKAQMVEIDDSKTLYQRLGEKRAIAAVVDHFVNLAAVNPKVNFTRNGKFKGMDVPFLKGQLTDFISMVTGGPVKYSGKDMAAAHAGMKIKASEFDALAADLVKALDKFNVPANEKNELMTLVATTKAAIVEVDDQGNPEPAAKSATPPKAGAAVPTTQPAAKDSLFVRLGGAPAITAVIDSFVNTAAGDKRVNFFRDGQFKNINVPHLKEQLVKFITMATGGPKAYNGLDMKSAHEGMKIKSSEFDAIAEVLSVTLDKFKVPAQEKAELMTIAASTKKDIVSQ